MTMKFYVEHNHKGDVNLNVNVKVTSEEPLKKEADEKEDKNKDSLYIIVGTIYVGISASLLAILLDNLIKSSGEIGGCYSWILFFFALFFLVLGIGYSSKRVNFNNKVFKALMIITIAVIFLVVVIVMYGLMVQNQILSE